MHETPVFRPPTAASCSIRSLAKPRVSVSSFHCQSTLSLPAKHTSSPRSSPHKNHTCVAPFFVDFRSSLVPPAMDSATERLRSLLGADAFEAAEKAAAEERPVECEASANQGSQSTPTSLAKDKIVAHAVFEESEDDDHQANTANLVGSRKKHQKGATLPPGQHGLEELAPPDMEFCPIMAVAKFPYRYMEAQSQESEEVSARFFANGKFWARAWTL